jgi:hypothetical protein
VVVSNHHIASPIFNPPIMPSRGRINKQPTTRKRQASNADEMANKRPKTIDNESGEDQQKKKGKKAELKGILLNIIFLNTNW